MLVDELSWLPRMAAVISTRPFLLQLLPFSLQLGWPRAIPCHKHKAPLRLQNWWQSPQDRRPICTADGQGPGSDPQLCLFCAPKAPQMRKAPELVLLGASLEPECYPLAHVRAAKQPSLTLFTSYVDLNDTSFYIAICIFITLWWFSRAGFGSLRARRGDSGSVRHYDVLTIFPSFPPFLSQTDLGEHLKSPAQPGRVLFRDATWSLVNRPLGDPVLLVF